MNDLIFQLDVHDGEMKHREAKNFLIANSLFVEGGVEETCFEILNQIHAGLVALNLVMQGGPSQLVAAEYAKDATLRTKIDRLKIDIRQILVPAQ